VELCQLVDVSGLLVAATRVMAKAMMAKTEDITGRSRGQDHGLGDSNSALLIDIRSRAPVTRAKLPWKLSQTNLWFFRQPTGPVAFSSFLVVFRLY